MYEEGTMSLDILMSEIRIHGPRKMYKVLRRLGRYTKEEIQTIFRKARKGDWK
jgi:hypothetical protein